MDNAIINSNMITEFSVPISQLEKNVLSDEAIEFATLLQKTFNSRRLDILQVRKKRQKRH